MGQIRFRRGLEADRDDIIPRAGEPLYTTDTKKMYVGDGTTPGGIAVGIGETGEGVPTGGTSGQVLAKASATDYDTEWVNQSGGSGAVDSVNSQTGTVVLDADDIDDTSTTHKFVTASDVTKLGNLSGTNTGDQDLSGYATTAAVAAGYQPLDADLTALAALTSPATKLNGIEAGADVTDTANVTAAGALMDSEVTNLAQVKAFNSSDYATAAQGAKADTATQPADIADFETTTELNARDTANRSRSNHTGTQSHSTISDYDTELAGTSNTTAYTPTADYHPATKKYVDDELIAAGGYNDEAAQDAVGTILTDSSEIDFTYDDATPSITASIVAGSIDETKLDTSVNASLGLADSALQSSDIANFETTTELNSRDTANRDRANHTGSQAISTVTNLQTTLDGKAASSHTHGVTDLTATGGTSTSFLRKDNTWATPTNTTYSEISEAEITAGTASTSRAISGRRSEFIVNKARDRANHTGTQTASTISDFDTEVSNNTDVAANTSHRSNTSNPHSVTASQVGLGNVDNTSDANKPISTATQTALDGKNPLRTKSTDANGWTVYNYGGWKEYRKRFVFGDSSMAVDVDRQQWSLLPEGMTSLPDKFQLDASNTTQNFGGRMGLTTTPENIGGSLRIYCTWSNTGNATRAYTDISANVTIREDLP